MSVVCSGIAPALAERRAALLAPGVDDPDPVRAALSVERLGVEVTDEPGAEHGDGVVAHESSTSLGAWLDASRCQECRACPFQVPAMPGAVAAGRTLPCWRQAGATAEDVGGSRADSSVTRRSRSSITSE